MVTGGLNYTRTYYVTYMVKIENMIGQPWDYKKKKKKNR